MVKQTGTAAPPLRAVIFDCDGILVDTEPLHYRALQKVLAPLGLGHDFKRYMEAYIGFDDRDAFLYAFEEAGRTLDADALRMLVEAKAVALRGLIDEGVPSFPGVVELVRRLAGFGIPVAVASGALRHEILAFVKSLGLSGVFSVIVAADEVRKSKPDPETYLLAAERLRQLHGWDSLDHGNCIAIEDTPAGILSARGAGLFVIGVTNSFPASDLAEADHVVSSLALIDPPGMAKLLREESRADS